MLNKIVFTKKSRDIVTRELLSNFLKNNHGILDCGSRDGALLRAIRGSHGVQKLVAIDWHNKIDDGVEFKAADLEQPLSFEPASFEVVICNDVIEHIELKTQLFNELQRVSSKFIVVSLPNTQHWSYVYGLIRGRMSKQYDFLVDDRSDRHRWVTYYDQNIKFIEKNLSKNFHLKKRIDIVVDKRVPIWLARIFKKVFVFNQVFLMELVD